VTDVTRRRGAVRLRDRTFPRPCRIAVADPRPALDRLRRTARQGVRTTCSPVGLRGAGTEAVWSLAPRAPAAARLGPAAGARRARARLPDAFWSDLDQLIVPKRSARIDHPDLAARNVLLRGVGHMSLPIDGRVVHQITALPAHLDEDGTTLSAGVAPVGEDPSLPATTAMATDERGADHRLTGL
jgi:hypothetical protein